VVLASAKQDKLESGATVRIDSTVTAALMHEPSDSALSFSLMRGYQYHVDSHGIRTVQSASCGDRLRSAAACTCQRSLPTLYSMLLLE
jgi:hypothetical protein